MGVDMRWSRHGNLFVRGARSPGGQFGRFGGYKRGGERPSVVDVDGVVIVFSSEIVAYLGCNKDGVCGCLQGRRTEKGKVVKHVRVWSHQNNNMLWFTTCRHSFRSFHPHLARTHSRTFVQTSQNYLPRISRNVSGRVTPASRATGTDNVQPFCERVGRPPIRRQVAACILFPFPSSLF